MKLTIRQVFFVVLIMSLFIMTLRPIADPDFWWHLRTGQLIFQSWAIPHTDPFSSTKVGTQWITHEWLSELFMYFLFHVGNYGLMILVFSIIITTAFFIDYLRCPADTRPYVAGFVLLLGAIATAPTWGVRPQMVSLLLASLFLFFLDRSRMGTNPKYLIPLPFIMLLWVNLHAGYFLGFAFIAIYLAGGLTEVVLAVVHKNGLPTRQVDLKSIASLLVLLGACFLASLVNPNGLQIIIYPFQTLTSPSMQQFIQEWFSPNFHQLIWQPLAWLILALIGIGMVNKKPLSPANIMLAVVFGYGALISMRNIPFFALVSIPILAEEVGSLFQIRPATTRTNSLNQVLNPLLIGCIVLIAGWRFTQVVKQQSKTESDNFPKSAVDWMLSNKQNGKLFNAYNWGGYLIWRTYPEYKVYIDGRADVYGDKFIFDYLNIYNAEPGWGDKLNDQSIQTVLIEPDSPLANALRQLPTWKIAYVDKESIIFTKR